MKTITLQILAEDIRNSEYTNSRDCAITRGLYRAGLDAHEGGGQIVNNSAEEHYWIDTPIDTPNDLTQKVMGMYAFVDKSKYLSAEEKAVMWCNAPEIEPQDFEYQLEIPDHW